MNFSTKDWVSSDVFPQPSIYLSMSLAVVGIGSYDLSIFLIIFPFLSYTSMTYLSLRQWYSLSFFLSPAKME